MTGPKRKKLITQKTVTSLREYVEDHRRSAGAQLRSKAKWISKNRPPYASSSTLHNLWVDLLLPASWTVADGALRLLEKEKDGWLSLRQGCYLNLTLLNLSRCYQEEYYHRPDEFLLYAFTNLLLGDRKVFRHTLRTVEKYPELFESYPDPYLTVLARFVCSHLSGRKSESIHSRKEAGPYSDLIRAISKEKPPSKRAIKNCCDYHLARSANAQKTKGEEIMPEFQFIPVEILALQRLGEKVGIKWPKVDHPLLTLEIPQPPKRLPKDNDSAAAKIVSTFLYLDQDLRGD